MDNKNNVEFFYIDDYNSSIERLGNLQIFLSLDLITFEFEGMNIRNPIVDETDFRQVLPSEYYSKAFLESDFMNKKKVEGAIDLILKGSEKIAREYCIKHELDFNYNLIHKRFEIIGKDFIDRQKNIIQFLLNYDLIENFIDYIEIHKPYYL